MARMPLPLQADLADIDAICGYLVTKPAGATPAEINEKVLGRRKLSALKFWGLIEDSGTNLRLSERGLLVAGDSGANRVAGLSITPYASVIARAVQNKEMIVRSTEVASNWHQHFWGYTQLDILNYQIVCFFRLAEWADLGRLVVGRKGHQTRFELAENDARTFVDGANIAPLRWTEGVDDGSGAGEAPIRYHGGLKPRVFITHRRMNKKIVEQVKELLLFGKFDPAVAPDGESAKRLSHDVMDEMRGCVTAVIHVGFDGLFDGGRNEEPRISGDVLIEIGAAMALFGRNFILLVEEGVTLPANLHGLCECRYSGEELDMPATMTLFKAFNDLTRSRPARPSMLAIGADHAAPPHVLQYERIGTSIHAEN